MAEKRVTQTHFNKVHNDIRSLLHRSGFANAHVEELACLLLLELAVDYHDGSRVKASKYLQDLGYKLGARIRDPGRIDIQRGDYKPSAIERLMRFIRKSGPATKSGVIAPPTIDEPKAQADVFKLAESKPRIIVPDTTKPRRRT
jgi:hypothetical protein